MKKFKFLFLVPALFSMVACGLGSEVKPEKAKEIAQNMAKVEEPKAYEAKLNMTSYDAETKSTSKASYVLKYNKDGDYYGSINLEYPDSKEDGYNSNTKAEVYKVADAEYEEVLYMKSYDFDEKKDEIQVVTKKGNPLEWAQAAASAEYEIGTLDVYMIDADDIVKMIETADLQSEANENLEIKYYSKGANNLTIKETMKKSDDKNAMWGEATITFDKGYLTLMEENLQDNDGSKMNLKIEIKYSDSIKISLPSDWKSHLNA